MKKSLLNFALIQEIFVKETSLNVFGATLFLFVKAFCQGWDTA